MLFRSHMPNTKQEKNTAKEKKLCKGEACIDIRGEAGIDSKRIVERKTEQKRETLTLSQKRKHNQCYVMLKNKNQKFRKNNSHIERSIYIRENNYIV